MLVGLSAGGRVGQIGAHQLSDEQLFDQFACATERVLNAPVAVVGLNSLASKFSPDLAWFRECWWEMWERDMLVIH